MPPATGTPTTVEAVCDALLDERAALLAQADRNRRNKRKDQAETCERHANGCAYAIGVIRRLG